MTDDADRDGDDRNGRDVDRGEDAGSRDEDVEREEDHVEREGEDDVGREADDGDRDDVERADDPSGDEPVDDGPRREGVDRRPDRERSLPERLHELAEDLLDAGSIGGEGRAGRISYGYTARTGPGGPPSARRRRGARRTSPRADRPDVHSTVERDGDDLRVVADLPGVDVEELTVGVDQERDELVVAVADRVLTRVPLEGADTFVNASLNNDVLTVRLTRQ
ncbi:alpha-crystallin domain-containing protein [Halorarum salinum]|uniref:Hsp20/alpha crystallin family protein n=1 Tax=Halorarum salinum TaxID=2743089 RepID=A0A7D5Q9F3_9EURY|nr:gas vesicle protein GvpH [Halobaculum salinum]QLG60699.1 hypothetical protein HUG12_02640 [Halobaculum salinum]